MDVNEVDFPALRVAYLRRVGAYGPGIGEYFDRLMAWAEEKPLFSCSTLVFAAYYDDPTSTPPQECRADVCITLAEGCNPEFACGIAEKVMSGGKMALSLRAVCDTADYMRIWGEFYSQILTQPGRVDMERPCYEVYYNCMESSPLKRGIVDFCIPVK